VAAPSRHLGLVPVVERAAEATASVAALAAVVAAGVDLDAIRAVARSAPALTAEPWTPSVADPVPGRPVVAVAGGPAFSFGYAETVELLTAAGAEVSTVDPIRDETLPVGTRALVVGGGFPEVYAEQLSANTALRTAVSAFAAGGGVIAAECAGLLWLCRTLDERPMCGILPADAAMTPSLTLGYRDAVAVADSVLAPAGSRVTGHEFHRTRVTPAVGETPAWVWRESRDGFIAGRVHASYLHLHWAGHPAFAHRLVTSCA
jgi:cobyrinic acid a,c-diamide synthase